MTTEPQSAKERLMCPTCGGPVHVDGDRREGTLHYVSEPQPAAIEVEAVAAERARIAAAVRALPNKGGDFTFDDDWQVHRTEFLDRAAVLAIVEGKE